MTNSRVNWESLWSYALVWSVFVMLKHLKAHREGIERVDNLLMANKIYLEDLHLLKMLN